MGRQWSSGHPRPGWNREARPIPVPAVQRKPNVSRLATSRYAGKERAALAWQTARELLHTADSVLGFSRRNCRAEHDLYGAPIVAFARGFLESRACEQWCSRACGVVNPLPILVLSACSGLCAIPVTWGTASRRGTTLTCPGEPADSGIPHDAAISRCKARPPITMLEAIEVMSRPRLPVSTRPRNAPPPARTSCQLAEATKTATTNTA